MKSSVAAILPTFNRAALLHECLDSLLAQTRQLDQIVVVDDGSADGTQAVLSHYAGRITILRQNNEGKAAALNHALKLVTCDYVWICDDDDIAEPYAAEVLADALDKDPGAGFSYAPFRRFLDRDGTREILPMSYWPEKHLDDVLHRSLERYFIQQFASLVRRGVYSEVGPFDAALLRSQDYDMMLRIASRAHGA